MDNELIDQAKQALDMVADLRVGVQMLTNDKRTLIDSVTPQEVKDQIAEIEAEFNGKIEALNTNIGHWQEVIKETVLEIGETVKGNGIMAVYSKPRHPGWDNVALDGYAAAHPEILKFRKEPGNPSVSIR